MNLVWYRAERDLHVRESLQHKNIPTPEDIDSYLADFIAPEFLKNLEQDWTEYPPEPLERYFVAKVNGNVVGYCHVERHPKNNLIVSLYIDPDYQRQGLGKRLWSQALQFLNPAKGTYVETLPYNSQAISYYRSLGFKETGRIADNGEVKIMKSGAIMPHNIELFRDADQPNV
jgi:ribosomal protein S18 acetylase RimI-like enzyme